MKTNIFNAAMNTPQLVIIIIICIAIAAVLAVLIRLVYKNVYKSEERLEFQAKLNKIREQRELVVAEKESTADQILQKEKIIEQKTKNFSERERAKSELMEQGLKEEDAERISAMSLEELRTLKEKESNELNGSYIINAITRKVLTDSNFDTRDDVEEFKVPQSKTTKFTAEDIDAFIKTLPEVEFVEKSNSFLCTYSTSNRSFVLLRKHDNGIHIKVKCGTYYGQQLTKLYSKFFTKSKFPSGMLWFEIEDCDECSFELVCLLIVISYNIARAGY